MLLNVAVGVLLAVAHPATAQIANRKPASPGYAYRQACPASCTLSGPSPSNWSAHHSLEGVYGCPQTLFYDFNVHDPVDDDTTSHRIYSCTSDWTPDSYAQCDLVSAAGDSHNVTYEIGSASGTDTPDAASAIILLRQLRHYLNQDSAIVEDRSMLFARFNAVSFGVYVGHGINSQGVASSALQALESNLDRQGTGTTGGGFLQLCGPKYDSAHTLGIFITYNNTFSPIQAALRNWAAAKCMTSAQSKTSAGSARFSTPLVPLNNGTSNDTAGAVQNNTSWHRVEHSHARLRRDECRTVQVAGGDSCASLAQKCGISGPDFTKYNSDSNLCSSLIPLQHVCCSSGTLPDFRPKPNGDGSCATYQIKTNDTCSSLAAANGLTLDELDGFNKKTWGWNGCDLIWAQAIICLSSGAPPMPAPLANAVCGPQVPGTQRPSDGTDISSLNPCPLNACCDIWGQCGVTEEFCIDTNTGAPGTAEKGTNGCISNCGTNIVRSDAPATFRRIGYFEGYSFSSRKCLYEDALQVDGSQYTHLHFAFATISPSFEVSTGDLETTYEFQNFRRLSGAKRIVSFGGWDFSTGPGTYNIFREGVTETNRQTLAANMAKFVDDWNLDGVDIDWEYPGAPDIPNIPPGSKEDGMNFLKFLIQLRILLKGKSLSIAAPASYWYLKGFPIKQISQVVDYIVFMTYDLHGQWDAQNKWSQPGCPSGMCLRSGVNLTETISSLVMVTKAGVPSNKVVVGVTSYGRSFAMAEAGCHGPDCAYTGTPLHSDATEGRCTGTAGYIADAEIHEILSDTSRVTTAYIDAASNTNILVYDNTQWVSYMSRGVQAQRTALYKALGMGGTTNWAIDLETFEDVPVGASWADFSLSMKAGLDPFQQGKRNGNWTELTCTDPSVEDNSLTPKQRWDQMDCSTAWDDAVNVWIQYKPRRTFAASISTVFHGRESLHCEVLTAQSNCDNTEECQDTIGSGTGPAGYEVLNSLIQIHEMYRSYLDAIHSAAAITIFPSLNDFSNKFAPFPPPPDNKAILILIDLFTMGASMIAAPFFNNFLKSLPYFDNKDEALANIKDTTFTLIGQSTTLAKDVLNPANSGTWNPERKDEFVAYLAQVVDGWGNLTEHTVAALFNGSFISIDMVSDIISDGKLIDGNYTGDLGAPPSAETLKGIIAKTFFAYTIPAIWKVSGSYPFVLDSGKPCGTIDPVRDYLDDDAMHSTWGCVDGRLYYLATLSGDADHCFFNLNSHQTECDPRRFSAPSGIKWLDGTSYGGITLSDLITGAVRTYKANGNANVDTAPDFSDLTAFDSLYNDNIAAAGFIRIPVCAPDVAWKHWFGKNNKPDKTAKGYPCG